MVFLLCYNGYAQLIDNRVNFYFGVTSANFSGDKALQEGSFISASLYPNYHTATGKSIKAFIDLNPLISVGVGFDLLYATDWNNLPYTDYTGSSTTVYTVSPTIQFHTRFKNAGISNRVKVFAQIAPAIGQSKINLTTPLFAVQPQDGSRLSVTQSSDIFYGIKGSTGLEVAINQYSGVYFSYSFQKNVASSKFYNDKQFSFTQMDFGIFLRFKRDKRYFY